MANKKSHLPNARQENLGFETVGSLNNTREIANAVSASIRRCPLSRYQIAAHISELVGREITKTMLDHYSGESHERHVIPADLIMVFCHVTGSNELKKVLLEPGETLAAGKDARYLELARKQARRDRLEREIEELRNELL